MSQTKAQLVGGVGISTAENLVVSGVVTATTANIGAATTFTEDLVVNGDARVTGILTVGTSSITLDGSNNEIKIGTGLTISSGGIIAGVTTVSAGSTSAPSITPTGDSNTGIFFPSADTIAFGEGGTERMRIDSSGNMGLGTNNPQRKLEIANGDIRLTDGYVLQWGTAGNYIYGNSASNFLSSVTSGTERMRIASTGVSYVWNNNNTTAFIAASSVSSSATVVLAVRHSASSIDSGTDAYYIYANGSAGSASDVNLKKNIETTRDGYLEDLNRLRVVKYNWNDQEDTEPRELGLIAQEVEEVFPGLACDMRGENEDGEEITTKGIKYSVLPVMLLKALQEADAKIEAQAATIAALDARLTALESV